MKKIYVLLIVISIAHTGFANHLKGGWIQYTYIGPGTALNSSIYEITVRQYLDCNSNAAQRDPDVHLGIFDGATNTLIRTVTVTRTSTVTPNKTTYDPCLSTKPAVCYIIDIYTRQVELPANAGGYTLTVQRCCRITGIVNIAGDSNDYGLSYTTKIPGTINGINYSNNKSPVYAQKDTAIICFNSPFTFDFSATDADGDSLSYVFCGGLTGGFNDKTDPTNPQAAQPNPPSNPPYTTIPYAAGFNGSSPLGPNVFIDPQTGIISGIAPSGIGDYVLSVCVNEFRNGVLIGTTKKEIHIKVADCTISAAELKPTYITCNGTTLTFQNESANPTVTSYLWDFGVASSTTDTSTKPSPTFDYLTTGKDSGSYTVKLSVSTANGCKDSATAQVRVYPGFTPGFTVTGSCYLNKYIFTDTTVSKYGTVKSWSWNFGDRNSLADTAHSKDSAWKYSAVDTVTLRLIVSNSYGCVDTVTRLLPVTDRPSLNLPFRDTLICSNDTLALKANTTSGTLLWTPSNGPNKTRITGATTNSPLVYPTDTTRYYVTVSDNGCVNTDSVNVNVLQFVTVKAGADTAVCLTDTIRLRPTSYALRYTWTASTGEQVQPVKYPLVKPLANTKYIVIANLGKCQAKDSMLVKVVPYPAASAGPDKTICYGSRVMLEGSATGTKITWTPVASLINSNTLTPVAGPTVTTTYVLFATDTTGCPKAKTDTLVVTVIPPVIVNAGRDTFAIPEQPLQLNATGGSGASYEWVPATGLNDQSIANPIARLPATIDSITYTVYANIGACSADDKITVRIFKTGPEIFVPSAFSPNGDGKNDVIKPTLVAITKLIYFSVYNRWGQLVFTTTEENKGWDGKFNGLAQPSGTYVYQASGTDYSGKPVLRKGTVVLVR